MGRDGAAIRILVAEDEPTGRALVARHLAQLGIAATIVADGREALAAYERDAYALVLTDLHMPEMDGFALAAAIRARGDAVPVVALTASDDGREAEACRTHGIDAVLGKPARRDELAAVIARLLGGAGTSAGGAAPEAPATPEPEPPPDVPVDLVALGALLGEDDPAEVRAVLGDYLATAPRTLARAEAALAAGDRAALAEAAHAGKGSARNVCARTLAAAWEALEGAVWDDDQDAAVQRFGAVSAAFAALEVFARP
jgi:CheY-like chemotaxis protein/HPt (histidine-containing phosphotransfer) domain-containing protein